MSGTTFQLKSTTWEWTAQTDEDSLHEGFNVSFAPEQELTTQEALGLIEQLAGLGCQSVCVQGGPITLRRDWEILATALVSHGINLALISNGCGIKENLARIKEYFKGVAITIEGSAGVHDMIKQKSGSFDRAIEALVSLSDAGVYAGVISTISNHNIEELENIRAIVGELGVKDWLIRTTLSSGAMKRPGYESYTLPPADIILLIKHISDFRVGYGMNVNAGCDIGYFAEEKNIRREPWSGCTGGIWTLGIESTGNVKMCPALPDEFLEGNIRDIALTELWNNSGAFSLNRNFNPEKMSGFCRVCEHSFSCACGCIASAYASTDSRYDNIYCFERIAKEYRFVSDHPGGGNVPMDPRIRSRLAKEELFRILQDLADKKGTRTDN